MAFEEQQNKTCMLIIQDKLLNSYQDLIIWVLNDHLNYKLNKFRGMCGTLKRT